MMRQASRYLLVFGTLLVSLLINSLSFTVASATTTHRDHFTTSSNQIGGGGRPATAPATSTDTSNTPIIATHRSPQHKSTYRRLTEPLTSKIQDSTAKNVSSPQGFAPQLAPPQNANLVPRTSVLNNRFEGLAAQGGVAPPDMALASSTQWVLQGVNDQFAVYSTNGNLQDGWPLSAQDFFKAPVPTPSPGSPPCATQAYMSDPRAFYDPIDKRFWVGMLEVEGVAPNNPSCPEQTLYRVAVSQTSDPNGGWNRYVFDMRAGQNTTNWADYVQFGFDAQDVYISANMINKSNTAFQYAEIFGANKATMEKGGQSSFYGWVGLYVHNGSRRFAVDTVQPVETEGHVYAGPAVGLFIQSFDSRFGLGDLFGNDCITTACHGLCVWTLTNPGTPSTQLSIAFVDTNTYMLPPNADQPGCTTGCVDTGRTTRISATPVYFHGYISFTLTTKVRNSHQDVSGIFYGKVNPQFKDNGVLAGVTLLQQAVYNYDYKTATGYYDAAAYYGAIMPDARGNLVMVYEFSSSSDDPGVAYVTHNKPTGNFEDNGRYLRSGDAKTIDNRWGDYEAISYDGLASDKVWFAGQYAASIGTWGTAIGGLRL